MKKSILTLAIVALFLTVQAQVKTLDTATCSAIISVQTAAIKAISTSDVPTKVSDPIRQQLQQVAQYFEQQRQAIIAEDKKKKQK